MSQVELHHVATYQRMLFSSSLFGVLNVLTTISFYAVFVSNLKNKLMFGHGIASKWELEP